MTQKLFLTSAVAMGFVLPAIAEPSHTGTFPSGGLMEADYTYTNAATSTNMAGVYEGTVNADAQYEDVLYQIAVGKYLPANSETTIDCDQNGYFCAGDNNGVYYSSSAQGLTQCPSGYGNTANGASANTDCYRTCTNADVEHSTGTVNGGYYYGDNNQCEPTDCVNGWHIKDGLNLMTAIGLSEAIGRTSNNDRGNERYSDNLSNAIISGDSRGFAIDFGNKGIIKGHGVCNTQQGYYDTINNQNQNNQYGRLYNNPTILASVVDDQGVNCYCHIESFIPYGSNTATELYGSWVYVASENGYVNCAGACATMCAYELMRNDEFSIRSTIFNSVMPILAQCEANTITINWGDTDLADVTANEAGTATYGEDIRTPVKAQTKAGKRFTGWRFSAPQQTQLP